MEQHPYELAVETIRLMEHALAGRPVGYPAIGNSKKNLLNLLYRQFQSLQQNVSAGYYEVWCDGSGTTSGNTGGWAAALVKDDDLICDLKGGVQSATNQQMELSAIANGIEMVPRRSKVFVLSDSEWSIRILTRKPNGETMYKRNAEWAADLADRIDWVVHNRQLWCTFVHVPGHAGLRFQEYVHILANVAREEQKR